jgi:hypothetical protein
MNILSESQIKRIIGLHRGEALTTLLSGLLSESQIKRINGLHREKNPYYIAIGIICLNHRLNGLLDYTEGKALSSIPLPSVKSASSVQICDSDNKCNPTHQLKKT